jgi:hypothetical protein
MQENEGNGNDATRFHCICMKMSKIHTPPNICTCGIFERLRYIETFIQLDTLISDMSFSFLNIQLSVYPEILFQLNN